MKTNLSLVSTVTALLVFACMGTALKAQTDWQVVLLEHEWKEYTFSRSSVSFEDWTLNAEMDAVNALVVETSADNGATDYSLSVESGNQFYRLSGATGAYFPLTFFSYSGDFMVSNRNALPGEDGPVDGGAGVFGFRKAAGSVGSLEGRWEGLQYEIQMGTESIYSWGYELMRADLNSDGTVDVEILVSTPNPDEVGEVFSGSYAEDVGVVTFTIIEDDETEEVEFQLSSSGDLMVFRMAEEDGDFLVNTFLKEADSVSFQDIAGTWVLSTLEFGQGNLTEWAAIDTETGLLELREDGSGSLFFMQSSLFDAEDSQHEAVVHFEWSLDGPHLTIDSANGYPLGDDAPVFTIGASKEIMRTIDYEVSGDDSILMIEYLVKVDVLIQPEVKYLPVFTPAVDYWGSWFGNKERIYTAHWPWVYFEHLGWMFAFEGDGRFAWFHDLGMAAYLGTDAAIFPFFFGSTASDVFYFDLSRSTVSSRWVYGFEEQRWIQPE
ncbi:MAG: hypothetical protein JJU20_07865 [Opitutales bacterium]|nr:hypothetical protein [Opitutales bacterium]